MPYEQQKSIAVPSSSAAGQRGERKTGKARQDKAALRKRMPALGRSPDLAAALGGGPRNQGPAPPQGAAVGDQVPGQQSIGSQSGQTGDGAQDSPDQASWLDSMLKGAEVYLGSGDEGTPYARALMRHFLLGGGARFDPRIHSRAHPTASMWSEFLASRPEIRRALARHLEELAALLAGGGKGANHMDYEIRSVGLTELESMRWTLHGCHRITISFDYSVSSQLDGSRQVVFDRLRFVWLDQGDLHPGTTTLTDGGEEVDDAVFVGAGRSFPIEIPFEPEGPSVWKVAAGLAVPEAGWPMR